MPADHPDLPPQSPPDPPAPQGERPLLSVRAFTVLLGAAFIGALAASLLYVESHSAAGAMTAGGGTFLLTVPALHKLIS